MNKVQKFWVSYTIVRTLQIHFHCSFRAKLCAHLQCACDWNKTAHLTYFPSLNDTTWSENNRRGNKCTCTESTSVCYIWPARDILMSLAYVATSGTGEVAALVSLCLSFTSEQDGRLWLKIIPSLRSHRVEAGKNTSTVIPTRRKRRRKGKPVVLGETVPTELREG
jgi:hypothetical protein